MINTVPNKHLYLLVLEVAPLEVGTAYDVLPSHCTLMHRFWSELSPSQLAGKLQPTFDEASAIALRFKDKEVFGLPDTPVTVNRLLDTSELKTLHINLYRKLKQLGVDYTAPEWVGDGYKAHVTERAGVSFKENHLHISKAAYLIEVKVPGNDQARFVRARFALNDST